MTFNDFRKKVTKDGARGPRRVRNSLGVYDYYKYYRKNRPKESQYVLTESQYFSIIRQVNKLIAEELTSGYYINLPEAMGQLEVRKTPTYVRYNKEGKLVTNRPIDWDRTIRLWWEDVDSYKKKIVLYQEVPEKFRLLYSKGTAMYRNQSFYEFSFNKELRQTLKRNICDRLIDAPLLFGSHINLRT